MNNYNEFTELLAAADAGKAAGRSVSMELMRASGRKNFEKWVQNEYGIAVPFSACKYKAKFVTKSNKNEIVSIFTTNKGWAQKAEPNKCTCYTLTYNDKVIYAALCGRDIANNLKKNGANCICEEYHGPANNNPVMGYYALMMHAARSMPVTYAAKRMNETYRSATGKSLI